MKINRHEMVNKLKKIAGNIGGIPTTKEFTKLSGFSESQIRRAFNNFTGLLEAAGLSREVAPAEKEVKQYERLAALGRAFDQQIAPYSTRFDKKLLTEVKMVNFSDMHSIYKDDFAVDLIIDTCRQLQPDVIGLVGDILDFYQLSSFSKNPSRLFTLQDEVDVVISVLSRLRLACPKAQIDYIIGNHEWRLFKFLSTVAPAVASLRCLRFDELLKLKEFEINLIANKAFMGVVKEGEAQKNYKLYKDSFILTHGSSANQQYAAAELRRWNKPGSSGHMHRHQMFSSRDLDGEKSWCSMGCTCLLACGEEYVPDLVTWTRGFEIVHLLGTKIYREYVHITDEGAVVGGKVHYRVSPSA